MLRFPNLLASFCHFVDFLLALSGISAFTGILPNRKALETFDYVCFYFYKSDCENVWITHNTHKFGISEFMRKAPICYNLDVIISVGYRVNSHQGTQFRIWATQRLKDYIIKGVALNDERFKRWNSMNYFKDLLERIREIRLSERVFYQ